MPFDMQPTLTGPTLELRPITAADYAAVFAAASDPLIWAQHPDSLRWREDVFKGWWARALTDNALAVVDRAAGTIVGSTRFLAYKGDEVEIGWTFLARSHWGGRANGEMKRLMLEHAFKDVARVVLLIGPDNVRSQKAAEKIGAVRAGMRKNSIGRESVVYEITRERFLSLPS